MPVMNYCLSVPNLSFLLCKMDLGPLNIYLLLDGRYSALSVEGTTEILQEERALFLVSGVSIRLLCCR